MMHSNDTTYLVQILNLICEHTNPNPKQLVMTSKQALLVFHQMHRSAVSGQEIQLSYVQAP